ncbi:MAG TPA: 1-deoxy-D-xylulose-5-phosphate synthase [Candidatus Ratteibacteria bacterium]|nr:1-deoxy-D-xylulose-5-phosphate synthase [Candidatus Ratteibacteria bacterium]
MKIIEILNENPSELKNLNSEGLENLANEIRETIIETVSKNGGHLASNLGVVELTIALHYVFNIPPDKIIWDVGHQCYTHKILTGRYKKFNTIRTPDGLSGFPSPDENNADVFFTGHAGTSISSSTGLKYGLEKQEGNSKVISVIGDGSLTNGLTFEGLNFLGSVKKNVIVILNDNRMSISPTKGALSYYLTKLITSPILNRPKEEFTEIIKKFPGVGDDLLKIASDIEQKAKFLIVPGVFFEKLGLRYLGPIDGHDIIQLVDILENIKEIQQPVVLHIITKKGKGYEFAEKNPCLFHSASPFDIKTGEFIKEEKNTPSIFTGNLLEKMAEENEFFVITAAMEIGLGLENFAKKFPERFFDVGIAESHAIVLAGGIAKTGMKVIVSIYSTFLQRGFDQIFHDICLQKLPVIFLVDRSGIVGEDGPTHHGNFDISFLRVLPNIKIFAPYSLKNIEEIIRNSFKETSTPTFIRYPKGHLPEDIEKERGDKKRKITLLGVGSMAEITHNVCDILNSENIPCLSIAIDRIKPLDDKIDDYLSSDVIATFEENTIIGGFGSSIAEYIADKRVKRDLLIFGLPDKYIEQGDRKQLLDKYGLSERKIVDKIRGIL